MKKIIATIAIAAALTGCSDPVQVLDSEYGVMVNSSSGADFSEVYSGNTLLIPKCMNECDYALTVDRSLQVAVFDGDFMVNASDLEVGLGVKVMYKLRDDKDSLKLAVATYRPKTISSIQRRIHGTTLGTRSIEPYGKDAIRATINNNNMTVEDIMGNMDALRLGIKATLDNVVLDSPVEIIDVRISRIAWPETILKRKADLKGLATTEKIQMENLAMERRMESQRQAVRVLKANNDLNIDDIYAPRLTDKMVTWQTLEVLDKCAENGCSLVISESLFPIKK